MKIKSSDIAVAVAFTILLLFYWFMSTLIDCHCDTSWLVGG